jgi:type I restriction enzyme S subunit
MSRIDESIAQLCPGGVRYHTVKDATNVVATARGVKREDYARGSTIPIVDQGQQHIVGYTDDDSIALPADKYIVFGDHTRTVKWINFAFAPGADGTKVLRAAEGVDSRYLYYALSALQIPSRGYNRHWTVLRNLRIPVPPIKVQREIVRTLDLFTELEVGLEAELRAEVAARQAQHAHYRSQILGPAGSTNSDDNEVLLSELVEFINGKPQERLVVPDGSIALLTARFISTAGRSARWVNPQDALTPARGGDIAMVMSDLPNGRALARCFYVEEDGKYTANQRVCLLRVRDDKILSARYLYRFLDRNPQLLAFDNGQDQTHLKKGQILGIQVPLTSLAAQDRTTATLDTLDVSARDLVSDLQSELNARRKQYEHYRDRLLSFKELAA